MKYKSTLDPVYNQSTVWISTQQYYWNSFVMIPTETTYSTSATGRWFQWTINYWKYLVNYTRVYTWSLWSIVWSFYLQLIPNDNSSKIDVSKIDIDAYSSTERSVYLYNNTIRFMYREYQLTSTDYSYWEYNIDTWVWSYYNVASVPTDWTLIWNTWTVFNWYTAIASYTYTGWSWAYVYTPRLTFTI